MRHKRPKRIAPDRLIAIAYLLPLNYLSFYLWLSRPLLQVTPRPTMEHHSAQLTFIDIPVALLQTTGNCLRLSVLRTVRTHRTGVKNQHSS